MNTESSHLSLTEKLHREATHNNEISGGNSPKRLKHPVVSPKPSPNHIQHAESIVTANHRATNTPTNTPSRDPVASRDYHALYNRIITTNNQVTNTPNTPLRDPVLSRAFHALYNIALKRNQVTPTG